MESRVGYAGTHEDPAPSAAQHEVAASGVSSGPIVEVQPDLQFHTYDEERHFQRHGPFPHREAILGDMRAMADARKRSKLEEARAVARVLAEARFPWPKEFFRQARDLLLRFSTGDSVWVDVLVGLARQSEWTPALEKDLPRILETARWSRIPGQGSPTRLRELLSPLPSGERLLSLLDAPQALYWFKPPCPYHLVGSD
jgi:hypothetical protein